MRGSSPSAASAASTRASCSGRGSASSTVRLCDGVGGARGRPAGPAAAGRRRRARRAHAPPRERSRVARSTVVAAAWLAMPWLPISHVPLRLGTLVAERTLYLPSVGAVLLAVHALRPHAHFVLARRAAPYAGIAAPRAIAALLVSRGRDARRPMDAGGAAPVGAVAALSRCAPCGTPSTGGPMQAPSRRPSRRARALKLHRLCAAHRPGAARRRTDGDHERVLRRGQVARVHALAADDVDGAITKPQRVAQRIYTNLRTASSYPGLAAPRAGTTLFAQMPSTGRSATRRTRRRCCARRPHCTCAARPQGGRRRRPSAGRARRRQRGGRGRLWPQVLAGAGDKAADSLRGAALPRGGAMPRQRRARRRGKGRGEGAQQAQRAPSSPASRWPKRRRRGGRRRGAPGRRAGDAGAGGGGGVVAAAMVGCVRRVSSC